MAATKTRKRAAAPRRAAKRKRNTAAPKAANPQRRHTRRSRAKRNYTPARKRRRNPTRTGRITGIASEGLTALVALVATRQIPQMALGEKNTGWMGYAGNIATALATSFVAGKVAGPAAAKAALIGGVAYFASRVLAEQLSPVGQYLKLAGIGDAQAATSLGTIHEGSYPYPQLWDEQGRQIVPQYILEGARDQAKQYYDTLPNRAPALAGMERYANAALV